MTNVWWLNDQERQPWRRCPFCGMLFDAMTGVNDRPGVTPGGGSVLVCIDCGEWGMLDDSVEGGWRMPTSEDRRLAYKDEFFVAALVAVRAARRG